MLSLKRGSVVAMQQISVLSSLLRFCGLPPTLLGKVCIVEAYPVTKRSFS